MQKWGKTKQGKPRFFCPTYQKTATPQRNDIEKRHTIEELSEWLSGKESLGEIAKEESVTRQALWKRFHNIIDDASKDPFQPDVIKTKVLIVDGTYIHGHILCALIAIDQSNKLYWKFAPYESYRAWCSFLSSFAEPEIIIMDGQKGLFAAAKTLWPRIAVQRCQFHLIAFAIQYIGRKPKEEVGKALLEVLYNLKHAKTLEGRDKWIESYYQWEKKYELFLSAKSPSGQFYRPRLRSARLIIRRALPNLFTFLRYSGSPNTTNLVEGWVNGAIAEALRLHRGLRVHEKKALANIILSGLERQNETTTDSNTEINKKISEKLKKAERANRARRFMRKRRYKKGLAATGSNSSNLRLSFPREVSLGLSKL